MLKIYASNKKEFRKVAHQNLKKMAQIHQKKRIDYEICCLLGRVLIPLIEYVYATKKRPVYILFYFPLSVEVNILPLIKKIRQRIPCHIFLPFMEGISFKMVTFRMPFLMKKFGIYEPLNSSFKPNRVDIAVVPVIGIDKHLGRIGYGKGMYDRFFATLKKQPITIFVARGLHLAPVTITDSYDIQADMVITQKTFLSKVKSNVRMDYPKFYRVSHCCRRWCLSDFEKILYKPL